MSLSFPSSPEKNDDINQTLDDQTHQTNHNGRKLAMATNEKDQTTTVRGRFAHATGTGGSTVPIELFGFQVPCMSFFSRSFAISQLFRFNNNHFAFETVQNRWAP